MVHESVWSSLVTSMPGAETPGGSDGSACLKRTHGSSNHASLYAATATDNCGDARRPTVDWKLSERLHLKTDALVRRVLMWSAYASGYVATAIPLVVAPDLNLQTGHLSDRFLDCFLDGSAGVRVYLFERTLVTL
jgi:hypothetical protein